LPIIESILCVIGTFQTLIGFVEANSQAAGNIAELVEILKEGLEFVLTNGTPILSRNLAFQRGSRINPQAGAQDHV
jgi:hypothetical protein